MATSKKDRPEGGSEPTKQDQSQEHGRDQVQGEGDYRSAREFNEAEREFVKSHDTEDLARRAAPKGADDAKELERAEREGKSHARPDPADDEKTEDPAGDSELGHS